MLAQILVLIIIILVIWHVATSHLSGENYRSCRDDDCDSRKISQKSLLVLNPFKWPYSGTTCPQNVFDPELAKISNKQNSSISAEMPPANESSMDTKSTPDHDTETS
jgi:hypothetical protein